MTVKMAGPAHSISSPRSAHSDGGSTADRWQPVVAALCCVAVFAAVLVGVAWSSTSAWGPLGLVAIVALGGGVGWIVSHVVLGRREP